jgi:hypothetical protein
MVYDSLAQLVELSARLGKNLDLVQAGGGNTSIKDTGTLWVKASGKWLSHAAEDDMFLPVPMAPARAIRRSASLWWIFGVKSWLKLKQRALAPWRVVKPRCCLWIERI